MEFNSITAIADLDTLIYLVAYNNRENEDVDIVINEVDTFMELLLSKVNATYYLGFIGGEKCFRHSIYPEYKSHRPDSPEWFIKWKPIIRHRLISTWGIIVSNSREAEDDCIISAEYYKDKTNVVLIHVDKDLDFWCGNHFNYQKHEFYYVEKMGRLSLNKSKLKGTGLKWQYAQVICGDSSDFIKGLPGRGPSFAYKLLNDCTTEAQLFIRTYKAYLQYYKGEDVRSYFKLQWDLIVMLKEPAYGFEIPTPIKRDKGLSIDELLNI